MKTVIFVWSHNFNINKEHLKKYNYFNETNFYFGLGDLIRATLALYSLSKKMNFEFFVDIQLHPISNFLKPYNHKYSKEVLLNKNNINYVCYGATKDYINEMSQDKISFIFTNEFYEQEVSKDMQNFIKNIFIPNDIFQNYINQRLSIVKMESYNILHYRLNDDEFLKKKTKINYNNLIKHVNKYKEPNDILITDTQEFKKKVFEHANVFMFDNKICHLGLCNEMDSIRDTLFEFFLITRSKKIKTYCKIHKVSGFVKWIGEIYDIPILIAL
jgi:hypothetical protein